MFTIGYYEYHPSLNGLYPAFGSSDHLDYRIKSYDDMLHQSLDKIIRERCFNNNVLMKEYKSILEKEPILSMCFPKNELKKLPLLWISAMAGYYNTAELLVRSGVNVNERFGCRIPQVMDKKWTILHLLLEMVPSPENERLIRLLTDHGAELQAQDGFGQTPLHYAVLKDRFKMTEMLLEKGADVNAAGNCNGMTPLLLAVTKNFTVDGLLSLLIKHGADLLVKDNDGWNALHYVAKVNDSQNIDLARILIEKGVSLHDRNRSGMHPIHLAITSGNDELVKFFLDHGVDVNAQFDGLSLLLFATQYFIKPSNERIVKTLLEHGADVNQRMHDDLRYTALHSICDASAQMISMQMQTPTSITGIIELLLCAGADVLAEDCIGRTPLDSIFEAYGKSTMEPAKAPAGTWEIIKVLALKKVRRPTIELKAERIMERYPAMWSYYQKCIEEIYTMKSAKLFGTCTLFDLLAKNEYQVAMLMKNPEFEPKFKLCSNSEFGEFSAYAGYLRQAFKRAECYFNHMIEQEDVINEAFYDMLPYLVMRKVIRYVLNGTLQQECKMNKV